MDNRMTIFDELKARGLLAQLTDEEEIKEYLAGNLCRCSGYEGQLRGILAFLEYKKSKEQKGE